MPRLLAIGDIHGASTAFDTLLEFVKIRPNDTLVTLGDYVDRGPDTKGVLQRLCKLQRATHLIPLCGNHDAAMLAAFHSRKSMDDWLSIGGEEVLHSYDIPSLAGIPREHVRFLNSLQLWHQTTEHIFVHANLSPEVDLADQDERVLLWQHQFFSPARHKSGKTMICGHTAQLSGRPMNWGTAVGIDTGAGHGQWLTCLDVRGDHYWQADQAGRTREGDLEPASEGYEDDDTDDLL